LQRCRDKFPDLHIISGVELGEPHWHGTAVGRLLHAGQFKRVLGSLHCLPTGQPILYGHRPAGDVVREYLADITRLIEGSDAFSVPAHMDYPLRSWPAAAGPFDISGFQDEFRHALRALARSGRAWRSTPAGRCTRRLSGGGAKQAEHRSHSEVTRTTRPGSRTDSPKRWPSLKPAVSDPAVITATTGGADRAAMGWHGQIPD
jgi:hypothetical protein